MKIIHHFIENFELELFNILKKYDNKELYLMVSGGSILTLFNNNKYNELNTKKWQVYFCDERLEGEKNIDSAFENMKYLNATIHPLKEEKIEKIDLAILGIGEDGHIASLFPNHPALDCQDDFIIIEDSPKEPKRRITVSINFLNNVGQLVFMVPPKNGKFKSVRGPHTSIAKKLSILYEVYLHERMKMD